MPEDAPAIKKANTKALGADVVTYDRYSESREELGQRFQERTGAALIPPYDYLPTMLGQGTSAIEVTNQLRARGLSLDTAVICCGGGGLAGGSALVFNTTFPQARVWAAEPDTHDDTHAQPDQAGQRVCNDPARALDLRRHRHTHAGGEVTFPDSCRRAGSKGASASDADVLECGRLRCESH